MNAMMTIARRASLMSSPVRGVTHEIPPERTKLAAPLYVHVAWDKTHRVESIRYSHSGKKDAALDRILTALSDVTTAIIQGEPIEEE